MRRNLLVVALAAAVTLALVWRTGTALGDNRPNSSTGLEARVALVDLAYIFKNYDKFTRLSDQMKADVQTREKQIIQAQQDLKELLNKRNQFAPDSANYKDNDAAIVKKKAELENETERARREFTQREANIYHQVYQEIEAAIKTYAESNGITLVLRAARDADNSGANPQDVIKEVSQQVIYALPQMDITDQILQMLNRSTNAGPRQTQQQQQQQQPGKPNVIQPVQKPQTQKVGGDNKGGTIKR